MRNWAKFKLMDQTTRARPGYLEKIDISPWKWIESGETSVIPRHLCCAFLKKKPFYVVNTNDQYIILNQFTLFEKCVESSEFEWKDEHVVLLEFNPEELCKLIVILHFKTISENPCKQTRILKWLTELGLSRQQIQDWFIIHFFEKPSIQYLHKIYKTTVFSYQALSFFQEKKLSWRHLFSLSNQSLVCIEYLVKKSTLLSLSTSSFLNFTETISDELKNKSIDLESFLKNHKIESIITQGPTPNIATQKIKTILERIKTPTLSKINDEINSLINDFDQSLITFDWDRTLENRQVILSTRIQQEQDFEQIKTIYADPNTKNTINKILDKI